MSIETRNAIIGSARFDTERGLSAWLALEWEGGGQGFGGYLLYAPKGWKAHDHPGDFTGHFIWRCLEVAGVDDWSKLAGRSIRMKHEHSKVHAIGHIVKDIWFNPQEEFEAIQAKFSAFKVSQ
jgi:hypothetical protein